MKLTVDILREFKKITSKDVELFFRKTISFFLNEYVIITAYYTGQTTSINSEPFVVFEEIKKECSDIFEVIHTQSKQLSNIKWWLLVEQLEEIDSRLKTLSNIDRWGRSSFTKVAYSPSATVQYTLKQNQTLERISSDILLSSDQEGWFEIARKNNLNEEDYSIEGGVDLQLEASQISNGNQVDSVVDRMIGKNIYGKDLYRKIQFNSTENDLEILGNDDTILQSVDILIKLKKNDNPDFPNEGLQSEIVVGISQSSLNFPIITRQLTETFNSDDSLRNFLITNLKIESDNLLIDYQIETRLSETYDGQIKV